jgi:hypothetical protein
LELHIGERERDEGRTKVERRMKAMMCEGRREEVEFLFISWVLFVTVLPRQTSVKSLGGPMIPDRERDRQTETAAFGKNPYSRASAGF